MHLRCLIVDDELNAIKLLKSLIEKNTQWEVVAGCQNAAEAIVIMKKERVDFIFLDVHMSEIKELEFVEDLLSVKPVVFVTGDPGFAIESFKYCTMDYLLKPVNPQRFRITIQKVQFYLGDRRNKIANGCVQEESYFFVKSGKTFHRIFIRDIQYFEGEKEYVRLVTDSEKILVYRRLKDIERQLPYPFLRVHNSYIVNVGQLSKIQENQVFIKDKEIPISEKYREHFIEVIRQKMF